MFYIDLEHNLLDSDLIAYFEYCFNSYNNYIFIQVLDSKSVINSILSTNGLCRELYSSANMSIHLIMKDSSRCFLIECDDPSKLKSELSKFYIQSRDLTKLITCSYEFNDYLYTLLGLTFNHPITKYVSSCRAFSSFTILSSLLSSILNVQYKYCCFRFKFIRFDKFESEIVDLTEYIKLDVKPSVYYSLSYGEFKSLDIVIGSMPDSIIKELIHLDNLSVEEVLDDKKLKFISNRNTIINFI